MIQVYIVLLMIEMLKIFYNRFMSMLFRLKDLFDTAVAFINHLYNQFLSSLEDVLLSWF